MMCAVVGRKFGYADAEIGLSAHGLSHADPQCHGLVSNPVDRSSEQRRVDFQHHRFGYRFDRHSGGLR
jgi:hypothetical protein